jgi:hypothetical protein
MAYLVRVRPFFATWGPLETRLCYVPLKHATSACSPSRCRVATALAVLETISSSRITRGGFVLMASQVLRRTSVDP